MNAAYISHTVVSLTQMNAVCLAHTAFLSHSFRWAFPRIQRFAKTKILKNNLYSEFVQQSLNELSFVSFTCASGEAPHFARLQAQRLCVRERQWVSEWASEWVSPWVKESVSEWKYEWMREWESGWVSEWMYGVYVCVFSFCVSASECMREWVSERVGEWVSECKVCMCVCVSVLVLCECERVCLCV